MMETKALNVVMKSGIVKKDDIEKMDSNVNKNTSIKEKALEVDYDDLFPASQGFSYTVESTE